MDSNKLTVPEMTTELSNTSGDSSLPSFHDTVTDNSMKDDADFTIAETKISTVVSDEEGFVSGDEEEFELASDNPAVVDLDDGKAFVVADFANKSPVVSSSGFSPPVARPSADDDDDDDDSFDDVVGDDEVEIEEGFINRLEGIGGVGFGDKVGIENEGGEIIVKESVDSGDVVTEKVEIEGSESKIDVLEEEKIMEKGVEESVDSGENVSEKVEVEGSESESGDVEEKQSQGLDVEQAVNDEVVEESKVLGDVNEQVDAFKFDAGVDAVVETITVDATKPGVAVVGDVGESKDFEVRGEEFVGDESLKLDNRFDDTSKNLEVTDDLKTLVHDAELTKHIDPVALDYVEHAEAEPSEHKADITTTKEEDDSVDSSNAFASGLLDNEDKVEDKNDRKADSVEHLSTNKEDGQEGEISLVPKSVAESEESNTENEAKPSEHANSFVSADKEKLEDEVLGEFNAADSADISMFSNEEHGVKSENEEKHDIDEEEGDMEIEGSGTDGDTEGMVFENSEAAKQFLEELEQASGRGSHSGAESSHGHSQRIDGQIVTDSEEEADTDEEGEGKELFDSAALAALLKAASGAGSDGGSITITSQDGSKLFSVERPAGLGSTLRAVRPAARAANRPNIFGPSGLTTGGDAETNLSENEKKKLEKLQEVRVKFLRLVQRLGCSAEDSVAAQVLYRLALVAGRKTNQLFSLDAAKRTALTLEEEGRDVFDFALNILVLGKNGAGKSATINSIFGEEMVQINTFESSTMTVKEFSGTVDGVKIRVIDTPGLKSSGMEQSTNSKILSSVKKLINKCPPDIVLYVDRLDTQTRDLNDMPLLKTITSSLGASIWRNAIVTLTHAASAPPDGPSGSPLSYEVFVAQRSHVVQQSIGQAVGDLRLMNPSLMNPVSLVENHPACRKNRDGIKVLPNGQTWRPQLLLLCYSMKILSEASSLSKPQEAIDHRKLFGFRVRAPPLPYLLSWLLQSRTHPKLPTDQGLENDSDVDLADMSDSDDEGEDEYDQLPPFKPLRKAQLAKLSKEQTKAYFEEYDYRVKLLQKKQWREELKRMKEIKKKGSAVEDEYGYPGEEPDQENGTPAAVQVPLPDMALPPSFDGENPAYRYRFLEPTSQFLARPVLDTHGWDHDCGYDGVNLEHSLAIVDSFPTSVVVQVTKDKKEFNIHLDSSVAAKHGENGSSMAGFDIQNVGKQLAYIVRGETKFKNFRKNTTTAGVSVTFLGDNVVTGLKVEDQIAIGKRLVLVGSTGTVRSQGDAAYGANLEVRLREADFPIGQDQSSVSLSLVKWRGDLALGANLQSQFSVGRASKIAVRAGLNNKLSGQVSIRTSTSDQLQIGLFGILPVVMAIYKTLRPPGVSEGYSMY